MEKRSEDARFKDDLISTSLYAQRESDPHFSTA